MVGVKLEERGETAAPELEKATMAALRSKWAPRGWEGGGSGLMWIKGGQRGQRLGQPRISS